MENQQTQTQSMSSETQQEEQLNPLARMHQDLMKEFIELGFTHSPTSPKAGGQGSQSPTRAYQVGFIPSRRTNQTQS